MNLISTHYKTLFNTIIQRRIVSFLGASLILNLYHLTENKNTFFPILCFILSYLSFESILKLQINLLLTLSSTKNKELGQSWCERQEDDIPVERLNVILSVVNSYLFFPFIFYTSSHNFILGIFLAFFFIFLLPLFFIFFNSQFLNNFFYTPNLQLFFVLNLVFIILSFQFTPLISFLLCGSSVILYWFIVENFFERVFPLLIFSIVLIFNFIIDYSIELTYGVLLLTYLSTSFFLKEKPPFLDILYGKQDFYKWICKVDFTKIDNHVQEQMSGSSNSISFFKKVIDKDLRNSFKLNSNHGGLNNLPNGMIAKMAIATDNYSKGNIKLKLNNEIILDRPKKSFDNGWNNFSFQTDNSKSDISIEIEGDNKNIFFQTPFYFNTKNAINKKNIIVIVMDALSKDVLSLYNKTKNSVLMEGVEQYFDNAAIYHDAHIQSEWTTACFANMFTSYYSSHHQATNRYDGLKKQFSLNKKTLAEVFQFHDYHTFFYSASRRVSQRVGYDRGFNQMYTDEYLKLMNHDVTYKAIDVLNQNKQASNFLVLHYMDTHGPPTFWSSLRDIDANFRQTKVKDTYRSNPEAWEAVYKNQVREADLGISILLNFLDQPKYRDNTTVIFTADHGQLLHLEKDKLADPIFSLEPLLVNRMTNIPLLVHCPWKEDLQKGNIYGLLEAGVDIYPSLLELAGLSEKVSPYAKSYIGTQNKPFKSKDFVVTESIYEGIVQRIIRRKNNLYYTRFDWREKTNQNDFEKILNIHDINDRTSKVSNDLNFFRNITQDLNLVSRGSNPNEFYGKL